MRYRIELSSRAERQLRKLTPSIQSLMGSAIDALAITPRPSGVKKLKGEGNVYRIRVRTYRIVYEVHESDLNILVIKIGHRRDIYQ